MGGHLPMGLAIASEEGKNVRLCTSLPYIHPRTSLFTLVKDWFGKRDTTGRKNSNSSLLQSQSE